MIETTIPKGAPMELQTVAREVSVKEKNVHLQLGYSTTGQQRNRSSALTKISLKYSGQPGIKLFADKGDGRIPVTVQDVKTINLVFTGNDEEILLRNGFAKLLELMGGKDRKKEEVGAARNGEASLIDPPLIDQQELEELWTTIASLKNENEQLYEKINEQNKEIEKLKTEKAPADAPTALGDGKFVKHPMKEWMIIKTELLNLRESYAGGWKEADKLKKQVDKLQDNLAESEEMLKARTDLLNHTQSALKKALAEPPENEDYEEQLEALVSTVSLADDLYLSVIDICNDGADPKVLKKAHKACQRYIKARKVVESLLEEE